MRGALLPVLLAALLTGGTAAAAPGGSGTDADAGTDTAEVTWSVRPSDGREADGRSRIELDLEAGASALEHIEVTNLSDVDATFTITAADGYYTPQGRFTMNPLDVPSTGAGTWITIDQPQLTIPAGASANVPFRMEIPADAAPGDHPAGIAASVLSTARSADGAVMTVDSRVGVRVLTRVRGELDPALALADLAVTYDRPLTPFAAGAVDVSYELRNEGNTALAVEAGVTGAGRAADADSVELFPGDAHEVAARVGEVWPLGFTTVEVRLVGSAEGAEPVTISERVLVWTVPWVELAAIAAAAAAAMLWLRHRRRRERRLAALLAEARAEGAREAAAAPPA